MSIILFLLVHYLPIYLHVYLQPLDSNDFLLMVGKQGSMAAKGPGSPEIASSRRLSVDISRLAVTVRKGLEVTD